MLVVTPLAGDPLASAIPTYGVGLVLHGVHLAALRSERTRLVAVSHVLTYLVWVTSIMALRGGGLTSAAALVYPPIVLVAGLTWSGRAALGIAVLASLLGASLVLLGDAGVLTPAGEPVPPWRNWAVLTACMVITGVILNFALGIIARSSTAALTHLRERIDADEKRHQLEERLKKAQRLEALGRLAGGVAHDVNNVLTVILASADQIPRMQARGSSIAEPLRELEDATRRAAELTRRLLAFGQRQVLRPERLDLNAVIADCERLLRRSLPTAVVMTVELAPEPVLITADRVQVEQVLMNLVTNARDALPNGGTIRVTVSHGALDNDAEDAPQRRDWITLAVADDGTGMSEETRKNAFEPFYTTKAPGRGTGLGLATVHGIVSQSGGSVRLESELGAGTTVVVSLPRAAAQPAAGNAGVVVASKPT